MQARPGGLPPGALRLAATAGALDPARCVAVEDSVAGVESARAAGLRVVAVARTYDPGALRGRGPTPRSSPTSGSSPSTRSLAVRAADLHRR
nr:HAD family phosphatase [Deltaproteobacteria bacterium]